MKKIIVILSFVLCLSSFAVDFESFIEKEMLQPANFYSYGNKGFGFFDKGDSSLKVFNWDFKKVFEFKITQGQGPGQLTDSNSPSFAFYTDKKVFVAPAFQKKVFVFSKKGVFLQEIKTSVIPQTLFIKNDFLIALNGGLNFEEETTVLAVYIDLKTGKEVKKIELNGLMREKSNLTAKMGKIKLTGLSVHYCVTEKDNILILDRQVGEVFHVNLQGKILKRKKLNEAEEFKVVTEKKGNVISAFINAIKLFSGFDFNNSTIVVTLAKKTKEDKYTTVLSKINSNNKVIDETLKGRWKVLGIHNNKLYLFETEEYEIKIMDM